MPDRVPTEAIKTGPSKEKLLPKWALSDVYLTERAPTEVLSVKTAHTKNKLLAQRALSGHKQRALSNIHLPDRAPAEAIQTGPSTEKLLPKRALSNIYLTERTLTEAVSVKTTHTKNKLLLKRPGA